MILIQVLELAGMWLIVSILAFALHLLSGVLSVGFEEVSSQFREAYEGPRWLALFILSAGLIQ